jgi:hypothetical protein
MTNEERARQWADLLTSYGEQWLANVPVDAVVHPNIGVIHLGGVRIARGVDGVWSVKP